MPSSRPHPRLHRALACALAGLALWCAALPAWADQISLGQSELCGLDGRRPDRWKTLQEHVVQGRNGPLGYYRFGRGTPIVLITGYRASIAEWNAYFLGELARHHDVIVFDNRGVGRSASLDGRYGDGYGMRDMADDAADLIASLGLRRATVVGWSMGGMIAQQFAAGPHRGIDRLVLIATAPPGPKAEPLAPATAAVLSSHGADAFPKIMGALFPPDAAGDAIKCFVGDMFRPADYKDVPVADAVASQQNRAMERWFADDDAVSALRRVKLPTLVVAGAEDDVLAQSNAIAISEMVPRAQLRIVDDAGHALMFQYPLGLARMIDAFVRR